MYSLNVPVPGEVSRVASDLAPHLVPFTRVRDRHTLLAKRFPDDDLPRLREKLRVALDGAPAFELRVSEVGFFERPPAGSAPVVYLAVESPGLSRLHDRLYDDFGGVDGLEGDDYVPHITLARDGTLADAERFAAAEFEPVTWTASHLTVWDPNYREHVAKIDLPA